MTKLTPKQQAFADLYIETANATTSYKNSGYSVKSDKEAAVEGSKLLRNPKVRAYIEERMDQKVLKGLLNKTKSSLSSLRLCVVNSLNKFLLE